MLNDDRAREPVILGRGGHLASACFEELDAAVSALMPPSSPLVCFNAHEFEPPLGAIVYNLENVGIQIQPTAFEGRRIWDFSARNVAAWGGRAEHVPVGFHPTMMRFEMRPWPERDIDVVMAGTSNERRRRVLADLTARGLHVIHLDGVYGRFRDEVLARAKIAINVLYYEAGTSPVLRSCHAISNRLPILSEIAPEIPDWNVLRCSYEEIGGRVAELLSAPEELLAASEAAFVALRSRPLVLPS